MPIDGTIFTKMRATLVLIGDYIPKQGINFWPFVFAIMSVHIVSNQQNRWNWSHWPNSRFAPMSLFILISISSKMVIRFSFPCQSLNPFYKSLNFQMCKSLKRISWNVPRWRIYFDSKDCGFDLRDLNGEIEASCML